MAHHKQAPPRSYYYASGQQIELVPDNDLVAINPDHLEAGAHSQELVEALQSHAQPLRAGIVLVNRHELPMDTWSLLEQSSDVSPVFRAAGSVMVAFPEVRVEETSTAKIAEIKSWLASRGTARIVSERPGQIVVVPVSGKGRDALLIANQLVEEVGATSVSPRFIRIVPRMR